MFLKEFQNFFLKETFDLNTQIITNNLKVNF